MPEETEQAKSSTSTEIALLRQSMIQVLQGQSEIKDLFERQFQDHETRLRALEKTNTELSARLTLWQILQTSLTAVVGTISTILGRLP